MKSGNVVDDVDVFVGESQLPFLSDSYAWKLLGM
jgi:hypothetical protein